MTDYSVEVVSWNLQQDSLQTIRNRVFTEEQGIPAALVWDADDQTATHFLVTNQYIGLGAGRLLADGKIGRMAVLPEHRGQGLGRLLLDGIIDHARRHAYPRLYLHAQESAIGFYEAAGFSPMGEPFEEAGIPHLAMELPMVSGVELIRQLDLPLSKCQTIT